MDDNQYKTPLGQRVVLARAELGRDIRNSLANHPGVWVFNNENTRLIASVNGRVIQVDLHMETVWVSPQMGSPLSLKIDFGHSLMLEIIDLAVVIAQARAMSVKV